MPNGKPSDHPLTDILVHKPNVYLPLAASLVREIAALADEKTRHELDDLLFTQYSEFSNPDIPELERYLTGLRDRLKRAARDRGFELDEDQESNDDN